MFSVFWSLLLFVLCVFCYVDINHRTIIKLPSASVSLKLSSGWWSILWTAITPVCLPSVPSECSDHCEPSTEFQVSSCFTVIFIPDWWWAHGKPTLPMICSFACAPESWKFHNLAAGDWAAPEMWLQLTQKDGGFCIYFELSFMSNYEYSSSAQ